MAKSRNLKDLEGAIRALRKHFLPDVFDPLGVYPGPDFVQAQTRAFVLLSHAEIEHYLECWAKEIALKAEAVWKSSGRMTKPFVFILKTLGAQLVLHHQVTASDSPAQLTVSAVKCFQSFYKRVKDNNGIRESNCLGLFSPLGVPVVAYGATLLPGLSSFGALRGDHAHLGSKAIVTPPDPETEYLRVQSLLVEFLAFDNWLRAYKGAIR